MGLILIRLGQLFLLAFISVENSFGSPLENDGMKYYLIVN